MTDLMDQSKQVLSNLQIPLLSDVKEFSKGKDINVLTKRIDEKQAEQKHLMGLMKDWKEMNDQKGYDECKVQFDAVTKAKDVLDKAREKLRNKTAGMSDFAETKGGFGQFMNHQNVDAY